jgi:hypothetical protein
VGLFDLLKPKSALEKAAKAIREPYSQPEYRREAMEKLLSLGTPEAYDALLMRFTFNAHGQIADEDEKSDLVDELVRIGKPAVGSVKKFIQTEKNISLPIRALSRMLSHADLMTFLVESLTKYEPLDHRSTVAKASIMAAIHDHGGPEHAEAVHPYLDDHHDDVQAQAINALERFKNEASREKLIAVCSSDRHSTRIQARAAQALLELEWPVKDAYDRFVSDVKSEFILSKKGTLIRRSAANAAT